MTLSRTWFVAVAGAAAAWAIVPPAASVAAAPTRGFVVKAHAGWHGADGTGSAAGRVAVSDGRVWVARVKCRSTNRATNGGVLEVESRRLDGSSRQRWEQTLPVTGDPQLLSNVQVDAVAEQDGRFYAQVTRSAPGNGDGTPAEGLGPRVVTFDSNTGAVLSAGQPDGATLLASGRGGGALFIALSAYDPATVRTGTLVDPVTGTTYPQPTDKALAVPVVGGSYTAGPFYAAIGGSGTKAVQAVVDAKSGTPRYVVPLRDRYSKLGVSMASSSTMEIESELQADGSIGLIAQPKESGAFAKRGLYAGYLDSRGHLKRIARKFSHAYRASMMVAAHRAIVSTEGGTFRKKGRLVSRCSGVWLSTTTGSRGARLDAGKLRVSGAPEFWDGTVGVWERRRAAGQYDVIVRTMTGASLHVADRPQC